MFKSLKKASLLGNAANKVVQFSKQHGAVVIFLFKSEEGYELWMGATDDEQDIIFTAAEVSKLTENGKSYLPIASFLRSCYRLSVRTTAYFSRAMTVYATPGAPVGHRIAFYRDGTYTLKNPSN